MGKIKGEHRAGARAAPGTSALPPRKRILSYLSIDTDDRRLMIADITGAFLYGKVTRDVNIELPKEAGHGTDKVGKLKKSLYGLRDAPQIWKRHVVNTLREAGCSESVTMPGILRHREKMRIAAHVDDLLVSGP